MRIAHLDPLEHKNSHTIGKMEILKYTRTQTVIRTHAADPWKSRIQTNSTRKTEKQPREREREKRYKQQRLLNKT